MKQLFEVQSDSIGAGPVLFEWSPNGTQPTPNSPTPILMLSSLQSSPPFEDAKVYSYS